MVSFFTVDRRRHRLRTSKEFQQDLHSICHAANTACAVVVIMTPLIFIIVSHLHAFLVLVIVHPLVVVEVILCFQHTPAAQSDDFAHPCMLLVILIWQKARPSSFPVHLEKIIASHSSRNTLRVLESGRCLQPANQHVSEKVDLQQHHGCSFCLCSQQHSTIQLKSAKHMTIHSCQIDQQECVERHKLPQFLLVSKQQMMVP